MHTVFKRVFAALLLAALLLCQPCLLSVPVAAEDAVMPLTEEGEDETIRPSVKASRFMSELFFGSDDSTHRVSGDSVVLPVGTGGHSVAYSTVVTPAVYDTPNNAVRLVLTNYSSATYLHVKYTYDTESGPFTETRRVDILPYSGRCVYPIRIDEADRLVSMTLVLPGCSGTSIVLHAMEAVRIWSETDGARGNVTSCTYHASTRTVTVKGSVFHDVMIAASSGVLGLFRLSPEQTIEDILGDPQAVPLVTSSLSIGFELQAVVTDVAARYARYAVLICMPDGTRLPLSYPTYATLPTTANKMISSRSDFKGIDTTLTSGAIDSNVGSAIVDVYLNRLENDRQSGYLYTVENEYFYFNRDYLAELDATVRSLSGAACRVYLRFLVEADDSSVICAVSPADTERAADPARYLSLRANDEDSLRYLHAYTTFLCSRYRGEAQGEIAGIIVGTRVDEAGIYNAAGELTLPEYVTLYGQAVNTVATAARGINGSLVTVVPVTDGWNAAVIGSEHRTDSYTAELFLESLAAYLSSYRGNRFSLMIESTHNPYGLSNTYFEPINTDGEDGPIPEELIPKLIAATQESTYVSSENITLLDTFLQQYITGYSALSDNYYFHWTPDKNTDGNALSTSYVYHYYRLFTDPRASAFFVSFRERELCGEVGEFSKIKYLVKYIDTPHGAPRTEFALDIFDASSWSAVIPDFNRSRTEQMTLLEGSFADYSADNVSGSYPLFDFSTANSTRGWYAGNYCKSLSVSSSERYGKTLDAEMLADLSTLAEYSDIAYRFDQPLILEYAPYITLSFAVDCAIDRDAVFEVKLVIGSDEGYMETKQVVKNGELVTVSLNAAQFAEISKVEYMRLSAKMVMGSDERFTLHLRNIKLDSREYDAASLQTLIDTSQLSNGNAFGMTDVRNHDPMLLIILGGAVLLCTAIVAMMLGHYQKYDSDSEEEGEE